MSTPQKEPLRTVTAAERAELERIAQATSERVDRVRRAWALLRVAQGWSFAVAVGAFADPKFPPPTVAVYEARRHPWTVMPDLVVEHWD